MTNDVLTIEEVLKTAGGVTPEQLAEAKERAAATGCGLPEALLALNVLGHAELGHCLSELHCLPYRPLVSQRPSADQTRLALSPRAAAAWGVFPLAHDTQQNVLTLAVDDPAKMVKVDRIRRLLMQSYDLAFTVASTPEIETAFQAHFGILLSAAGREKLKFAPIPKLKSRPGVVNLFRKGKTQPHDDVSYQEMSKSLRNAVSLFAAEQFRENPTLLHKLERRVRYCTLLAARLNLSPIQTDGLTLAAWLSPLEHKRQIAQQMAAEYGIAEILFSEDATPGDERVEAQILSLVECYQDLLEKEPDAARDVNLVRARLRTAWASFAEEQAMLEVFLQVLVDEDFLADIERRAASVLIIDPTGAAESDIMPTLTAEGYAVSLVSTEADAWNVILAAPPNLIISCLDLTRNGLEFCEKVKRAAQTAQVGFFVVADPEVQEQALACLRAGADDFLTRPIAAEVIAFKTRKFMSSPESRQKRLGLSGSLGDVSLADMIQILSAGSRSVEIALTHASRDGLVVMENGGIVHARCGEKVGESALFEIMRWETGEFTTRPVATTHPRTIRGSVMSLLMEGARVADESRPETAANL